MFDSLKLTDLPKRRCAVLGKPTNTRPTIWRLEENGVRAVVKDFSNNRFLFRNIAGRFLVWREAKAYKKISNLKGIPTFFRVIGGLAIVTEEISGMDLATLKGKKRLPDGFFDALKKVVDGFHKRGVVHCDLKSGNNILLGHDGLPYIIDWAAAISRSEFSLPPLNLIYKRFVLDDYNAIIKQKLKHAPELVDFEEKQNYYHRSWAEKSMRALRDSLRTLLKKIA
jgi:RIO-like serine/threonine protein kinase